MTVTYGYSLSFIPPGFRLPSLSVKCDSTSILSFTLSFYMNVVDGAASLVEVISNRFFSPVFNDCKVSRVRPSFTDVELSTSSAMNEI